MMKILRVILMGAGVLLATVIVQGQFVEEFGHQGTFNTFRGQVRSADDSPVPFAELHLTKKGQHKETIVETDEDGKFFSLNLPSGNYYVRIEAHGFNILVFSLSIRRFAYDASDRYIVAGLSPGCASGGFGIKLVRNVDKFRSRDD